MTTSSDAPGSFADLALPDTLLRVLRDIGYESPSPIQAATIPPLLAGRDLVGQAQTGTGKTAAFALPILAQIDTALAATQALVLAPTRELAIQVAEAFQKYATHLPGFHVLPVYGGQAYGVQLHGLKRGAHVVVGTPGRVIDHLERGTLDLARLKCMVLDEADEMLRMGFIDDVEKILRKTPAERQTALFSATMPPAIKRIAQTYLREPVDVAIEAKTRTATNIRQRYWLVSGLQKLDALTRFLEVEEFDGMIIFARTKQATEELAEKLEARGFSATAINGDIAQPLRERAVQKLKDGQLDILVATDVAARGLDVDRISHVLNYDIPYDTESYVHRIGRTGRAGRSGEAILFVAPRERGMLRAIERATRQPIEEMVMPGTKEVNEQRIARFKMRIGEALASEGLDLFRDLVADYEAEHGVAAIDIAAALARMAQGEVPLLLKPDAPARPVPHERGARRDRPERARGDESDDPLIERPARRAVISDSDLETYRIAVGHLHHVKPGNIVGAIANEAGLESRHIGRIDIRDDHSFVDLPRGMPDDVFEHLKGVRVGGQRLQLTRHTGEIPLAPKIRRGPGDVRDGKPGGFRGRPGGDDRRPPRPRGEGGYKAGGEGGAPSSRFKADGTPKSFADGGKRPFKPKPGERAPFKKKP
ncbi:ATP-dependent RNA helicase DeaD [Chiayiivirga flava]|uniref:ATP-dependent RNA helicase DeaD n=1 Tax=Chiayiivirga flava TaxID=659595 RepID=A0A7W8G2V0_9GAMM|nr:DEAD/DEAH box helicase [Chiayiivirga flava]MBB5209075.1 ATP-dependent RNA helicase DeaD [Chiayiivirga flava]